MPSTTALHGSPNLVHIFIPLPDPIKIPNLTELPVSYVWNPISDDGPCFRLPSKGNVDYAARQIMVFHQDEVPTDTGPFRAAMKIMHTGMQLAGVTAANFSPEDFPALSLAHTTVEVICVLDPAASDPVDRALAEAIDAISDFQMYYHLSTKTPVRRLTRKLLPPLIPIIRRFFPTLDTWEPELFHVNDGGTNFLAASVPTMSNEQLQNLLRHNQASRANVFSAFLLMRQEAMLSYATGSNAAAGLFVAIAAETFLTELFLLLSWEEAADLEKTAEVLGERDNISKRLLNELAGRLKGDWDRNGHGPLGNWQRNIANLRNDVAHAGKLPSEAEIELAMKTLTALETHAGDLLVKVFRRYPQVTEIFLGNDGLERRNRLKAWQKFSPTVQFPVHASELFTRWKGEVQRVRSGPNEGVVEQSKTIVVRFGNGAERWYLVDEARNLSCSVPAPKVVPSLRTNLNEIFATSEFDVTTVEVPAIDLPPSTDDNWVPSYLVLPMASIHRWEQCLWVPPPSPVSHDA